MLDVGSALASPIAEAQDSDVFLSFSAQAATPAHGFIAVSSAMKRIRELVRRASASNLAVVIVGEANTGKEFLARLIHAGSERRRDGLLSIDASFDSQNVETAIATAASRWTLLVTEIADMALALQLKVLRSCASAHLGDNGHLRLLATASLARHRRRKEDPRGATSFRRELYRQHGALIIEVPPLRDRREDIVPLARHFLAQTRREASLTMDPAVERELEAHDWPGNLAELQGMMIQVARATHGNIVTLDVLRGLLRPVAQTIPADLAAMPYHEMLEAARTRIAREYFTILLRETRGNVTHAAARAGVGRESLHRILKHLGLSASDFRRR